ncbi:MAG: 3-hydroxyacyl-CoA dehydrogenase family protein [Paludibacter sp.]|nr:3-hydroxyacyl-CoA dehydrogenase family protein [Paludibacter sp.]MDD4197958.1 3-hydroxyacyl-CoA dehydrogenase family protein [Paludibacter sp.]MDD4427227.1 3-hydroxyacyl-CoA dehydrogenase family protein [Paludibacter sp.]
MAKIITEPIERYGLSKRNRKRTLFSRIGVVGCGIEGSEIATTAALNGMEVVFLEPNKEKIANAFSRIEAKLDQKITNWGLTLNEKKAILSRVQGTTSYVDFQHCDFVIEAIRYNNQTGERQVDERKKVFQQLEQVLEPDAVIASNVTTVVVTELASELKYPERCIGVHFMINTPGSQILEIVSGLHTSQETFDKVSKFARMINHQYISVMESSGLVSIRLFLTQLNEACQILMEGISNVEDIDKVLTVGYGHSQGVFRTADNMGIEKIVKLLNNLYEEYGNIKYKPSPVLLRMVRAKNYGVSTGKGFYVYDESGNLVK